MDGETISNESYIKRIGKDILIAIDATPPSIQHIFKVPNRLRQRKDEDKIYDPEVVSIGPYHHQTADTEGREPVSDHLKAMETHKKRYLYMLLQRKNQTSIRRYVRKLEALEHEARLFYADPIGYMNRDEFVEMMLLDGFFIIELFRKCENPDLQDNHFPLSSLVLDSLLRDLLLLENQLPFFVLQELFNMTRMREEQEDQLVRMAVNFFSRTVMQGSAGIPDADHMVPNLNVGDVKHLLDLLHKCWRPSREPDVKKHVVVVAEEYSSSVVHKKWWRRPWKKTRDVKKNDDDGKHVDSDFMPCATKLKAAGIKFKKLLYKAAETNLFDLKFNGGVLWIPRLIVDRDTEKILSNLVAYEQCRFDYVDSKHVTDYVLFMDSLIDAEGDVEILVGKKVIENWYSTETEVANMFNRLGSNVLVPPDCLYSDIFNQVRKHCDRIWNRRMAVLKQDYFNTPWAIFSFCAAIAVVVLTITQTIFTIYPYYHPRN